MGVNGFSQPGLQPGAFQSILQGIFGNQQQSSAGGGSSPVGTTTTPPPATMPPGGQYHPSFPYLPPEGRGVINPGEQSPLSKDPFPLIAPPGTPGPGYANYLPPILRDPFVSGINATSQSATAAGMALPNAAGFHAGLYSPFLNPMEQSFLGASSALGLRGLTETQNRLEGAFENTPGHSAMAPAMLNAGNQFAEQMMSTGSQMGLNRMGMASQAMPFTFGFPIQAAEAQQNMAGGLQNMLTQGMYGDMQFPMSMFAQTPMLSPTIYQPAGGGGGGSGKK